MLPKDKLNSSEAFYIYCLLIKCGSKIYDVGIGCLAQNFAILFSILYLRQPSSYFIISALLFARGFISAASHSECTNNHKNGERAHVMLLTKFFAVFLIHREMRQTEEI